MEALKQTHAFQIDAAKYSGCGLRQWDYPASNLLVEEKKARVLTQACILCEHCVAVCPRAAVSMTEFDLPPVEIEASSVLDPQALIAAL